MKTTLDVRGIVTVLNTPFTADDTIDVEGLERHVAYALSAKVAGFLIPAMASEVGKLSPGERELMVRTVVRAVGGKAVVIGGASADTVPERVRLAGQCLELGCDGILVNIPYSDAGQYAHDVQTVAGLNPPFLMVQDWAADGYGVPVPVIQRLFEEVPNFRCLKVEVVPAGVKYSEVLEATGGKLHVSGGWAVMQIIEALDRGVHAFMPTALHFTYTRICALYAEGKRDAARALHARVLPILAFSNQHLDISIHFFKRLLHAQGLYSTPNVREPILPFDRHHLRMADELIARAMALETRLGWKP